MLIRRQLFIVWNQGKRSPIHDHANAHCVMKIVKGNLKETVYHMPEPACSSCHTSHGSLKIKKETVYQETEVAYISDQIGLHHVANPGLDDVAVSLHCKSLHLRITRRVLTIQCTLRPMLPTLATISTTKRLDAAATFANESVRRWITAREGCVHRAFPPRKYILLDTLYTS